MVHAACGFGGSCARRLVWSRIVRRDVSSWPTRAASPLRSRRDYLDRLHGSVTRDARFAAVERVQLRGRQPGLVWLGDRRIREPSARDVRCGYRGHDHAAGCFSPCPRRCRSSARLWLWKRPSISVVILLAVGAALILSTYPRWDLNHLTWVSAPFYALVAALIAARPSFRKPMAVIALIAAGSCFMVSIQQRLRETTRITSVGAFMASRRIWMSWMDPGAGETFRHVVRLSVPAVAVLRHRGAQSHAILLPAAGNVFRSRRVGSVERVARASSAMGVLYLCSTGGILADLAR